MSANGNGLREKVEFPLNQPVLLQLDYDEGKLSPGKFGDQYQCTFDAGARIAWLDPEVHALILKTGARAGDEIAITKRETKNGNRKRALWEVEKVEEESGLGPTPAEEAEAERAAAQARASRDREAAAAFARAAAPQVAQQKQSPAPLNNAREDAISQTARTFADCVAAAVQAARISAEEAQATGFTLPWDKADVRAIATTLYIQRAGRGGQ